MGRVRRRAGLCLVALAAWLPAAAPAQSIDDQPMTESETQVRVMGEEDVDTPVGLFRTVKVERVERWKNVRTGRTGTATTVYWYNAQVKRYVKIEWNDQMSDGRVLSRESAVLLAFSVR